MVKFTKSKDELLIQLVKGHKILYDTSDDNFKNNILKHKSWEEISAIIGVSVSECKKRWKSLRDQYNKKKKGDLISGERANSTWEYMNLISFLSETAERRENSTNCDGSVQQIVIELVKEENTDHEKQDEEMNEEICQHPIVDKVPQLDPPKTEEIVDTRNKRRIIKRRFPESVMKNIEKRRQRSAFYDRVVNKTPTQKFFESMSDIVDKLPTTLQAEVRLKVCQVVTEAELKHHTQHSMYPNLQSCNQLPNIIEYPNISCGQDGSIHNKFKEDVV